MKLNCFKEFLLVKKKKKNLSLLQGSPHGDLEDMSEIVCTSPFRTIENSTWKLQLFAFDYGQLKQ